LCSRGSLVNSALALPIVAEQKRASFSMRSQDVIMESGEQWSLIPTVGPVPGV
jgi:hypothetical protein